MKYVFIFIILLVPFVSGWNWNTHTAIVDSFYYGLDEDVRGRLNLSLMEYGGVVPDKEFRDYVRHSYPKSYAETSKWLEKAKEEILLGDYDKASLSFGIASHYVVDSFSSPHGVNGEEYSLHKEYEDQGSEDYFYVECVKEEFDLQELLQSGLLEGKNWGKWVETKDKEYPLSAVASSMGYVFSIGMWVFDGECYSFETEFEDKGYGLSLFQIISCFVIVLVIVIICVSLYMDFKR